MSDPGLEQFAGQNYLSLETFKRNGEGVKTPVWFVQAGDVLYVYTDADSWKVRRIRNNPRVRVAVCTVRGRVTGPGVDMKASFVDGHERHAADALLNRKYFLKRIGNLFSKVAGRSRAMIRIART